MHPHDHARASQRRFGGEVGDYRALHDWFDATKVAHCHFTHRALRHHREGIAEAVERFGAVLTNAAGDQVDVAALGRQHLVEDCAFLPAAADWAENLVFADWVPGVTPTAEALSAASARRHGADPADHLPLHRWFLATAEWVDGPSHLLFRHHAFGIFEAEQRFGPVIGRSAVPTRVVAERHVRDVLGRVPAASDWLRRIRGDRWMFRAADRGIGA